MAITEIVSDIAGVGPTASFVLGANTMAPYAGVQIIGLTDGTSPATASKNMAEIYNLNRFERKLAIEMAGLTYDPTDDSQFVRAMQLLPNLSSRRFAVFPSVLAPTSAPSLADPATVKTNTNAEVFMWNGAVWVLVANGLISKTISGLSTADTYGAVKVGLTWTAPREGYVEFTHVFDSIKQLTGTLRELVAYSYNSIEVLNQTTDAFTYNDAGFMSYKFTALVAAGQVVSFGNYSNGIVQGSSLPFGNVAGYSYYNRLTTQYVS